LQLAKAGGSPASSAFEERHDAHLMAIVERGTFSYSGAIGRELLTPGSVLTANSGNCYRCHHTHDGGDTCLALQINDELFEEIAHQATGSRRFSFASALFPIRRGLMPEAAQLATVRDGANTQFAVFAFAEQLLQLASGHRPDRSVSLANTMRIERSLRHAEDRLAENLSLAELAQSAGLSRFHFARLFKLVVGRSPYDHVLKQRLLRAARLLIETRKPVLEIALDCGFGDLSTFNAAFKFHFKQTPSAFRRRATH